MQTMFTLLFPFPMPSPPMCFHPPVACLFLIFLYHPLLCSLPFSVATAVSVNSSRTFNADDVYLDTDLDVVSLSDYEDDDGRIFQGKPVKEGKYPYIVSIRISDVHTCGGTLISHDYILTAAHCLIGVKLPDIKVYVGHANIKPESIRSKFLYKAKRLVIHKKYQDNTVQNGYDIGLIQLRLKVKFNHHIAKVCLPGAQDLPTGPHCAAIGWGRNEKMERETKLQMVHMYVVKPGICKKDFPSFNEKIIFCAKGDGRKAGTCRGDSGGPIICAIAGQPDIWVQFGIVSFGASDCLKFPGYYTKVNHYLAWIRRVTGEKVKKKHQN